MKKVAVIFTGSELLRGKANKDAVYLGRALDDLGLSCEFYTVGDNRKQIKDILNFVFPRADILMTVGGLGATFDDLTIDAVSDFTGQKRVLSREALQGIAEFFINKGMDVPKYAEKAAYMIEGAKLFANPLGFAPAQSVMFKKTEIIMLPGPPAELKAILKKSIIPRLKKKLPPVFFIKKRLHIIGLSEGETEERIKSVIEVERFSGLDHDFTILAGKLTVDIEFRLKGDNELLVEKRGKLLEKEFRDVLGDYLYGTDGQTIVSVCARMFSKTRRTLSVAESCTGGEIAHLITNTKGASAFFDLGVVVYTEKAKSIVLGIPLEEIKKAGVVSEKTSRMMAEGLLKLSDSYYALATTGVAGPGPSAGVKQGTVFIALAKRSGETECFKCEFSGSRLAVKKRASMKSLDIIRKELLKQ